MSAREFLAAVDPTRPFIPELHTDDCDDTSCVRCEPTATVSLFVTPDHRVWLLNRDYVDVDATVWHWDGRDFDPVAGPEMVSPAKPLEHMPLVGLAKFSGLHSDMHDAVDHGELILQQHDAIEAGLTGSQS